MEPELEPRIEAAKAAWPDLHLPEEAFVRHLRTHLGGPSALGKLHIEDLYLAFACARGDDRALAALDRCFLQPTLRSLARRGRPLSTLDELAQVVRSKLLLPRAGGRPPLIADYAGTGPLARWLRVIAVRELVDLPREKATRIDLDPDAPEWPLCGVDPELDLVKARYRPAFTEAFRQAFAALTVRQRNLLRYYYLDGLPMERMGHLYHVAQPTISRWLKAAQAGLADKVKQLLASRLGASAYEIESLLRAIGSQLNTSLSGLLQK